MNGRSETAGRSWWAGPTGGSLRERDGSDASSFLSRCEDQVNQVKRVTNTVDHIYAHTHTHRHINTQCIRLDFSLGMNVGVSTGSPTFSWPLDCNQAIVGVYFFVLVLSSLLLLSLIYLLDAIAFFWVDFVRQPSGRLLALIVPMTGRCLCCLLLSSSSQPKTMRSEKTFRSEPIHQCLSKRWIIHQPVSSHPRRIRTKRHGRSSSDSNSPFSHIQPFLNPNYLLPQFFCLIFHIFLFQTLVFS